MPSGMLGRGQLRSHVILELVGQIPCFLLANAVIEEGFPSMGVCLPYAATRAHICAPYCNGSRLGCCQVPFVAQRGGMRRSGNAHYQQFWVEMQDMLPRPHHTVHTYLIGLWTLQRNHGHTGGTVWRLRGGFDGLLESEVSNLWAKHGSKLLQNEHWANRATHAY